MKRSFIIIIAALAVVLFLLFSIKDQDYKRPVDWTPSYSRFDKNPYGCFIVYEEWNQVFPGKALMPIEKSVYDLLDSNKNSVDPSPNYDEYNDYDDYEYDSPLTAAIEDWYYDYDKNDESFRSKINDLMVSSPELLHNDNPSNFIFISEVCSINERDTKALLEHIIKGNTVMMSAHSFAIDFPYIHPFECRERMKSGIDSNYIKSNGVVYRYKKNTVSSFFHFEDDKYITVLARNNEGFPVLIKVNYGKGSLILSSTPLAFTNYNMLLSRNYQFVEDALKELNLADSWWCGNYLAFDFFGGDNDYDRPENDRSIMQFIHSQPALSWAFYSLLGALLVFLALATKRKQREIPTYKKPLNTSVEFTNTISKLYLRQKDHRDIGEKMITYFYEEVRNRFYLNPSLAKKDFNKKLSDKSGVDLEEVAATFKFIELFKQKDNITEMDITALNRQIQNFKNKCR